jgi:hypothetical protein
LGRPDFGAPIEFGSAWADVTAMCPLRAVVCGKVSEVAAQHIDTEIKPLIMSVTAVDKIASFIGTANTLGRSSRLSASAANCTGKALRVLTVAFCAKSRHLPRIMSEAGSHIE